ncbi:MAG: DEAD/DEAH box helicase [Planctomycetota bacterium]|nr:DEAD/DEAH box helicase [Planctomycetota bacterium]
MTQTSSITFTSLGLSRPLLTALTDEGYTTPTPIQAQAIPAGIAGRDLLGVAQTGTGKTAAFGLPILHRLSTAPRDASRRGPVLPRALILSPTRELASQIGESFAVYGRHTGLAGTVIFGGVSQFHQVRDLHRGVDILVATPGRLIDLMEQRLVNLTEISIFVLDEADRMLDMGFIKPIRRIAAALPAARQTMLFSATLPREIVSLAESLMRDPVRVSVSRAAAAEPKIEQAMYMVPRERKQALLTHLLREGAIERAVVFTKTKHGADRVARRLHAGGIHAVAIHGNKAQNQRTRALDSFRAGHAKVLVATDVAARGLDVDGITHVFNFDLPMEPEAYVHRIGRTGRAGASGIAVTFCDSEERDLLRAVERTTGARIPTLALPALPEIAPDVKRDDPRESYSRPQQGRPQQGRSHHVRAADGRSQPARATRSADGRPASDRPAPKRTARAAMPGAGVPHKAGAPRPAGAPTQRPSAPPSDRPAGTPRHPSAPGGHAPASNGHTPRRPGFMARNTTRRPAGRA